MIIWFYRPSNNYCIAVSTLREYGRAPAAEAYSAYRGIKDDISDLAQPLMMQRYTLESSDRAIYVSLVLRFVNCVEEK